VKINLFFAVVFFEPSLPIMLSKKDIVKRVLSFKRRKLE